MALIGRINVCSQKVDYKGEITAQNQPYLHVFFAVRTDYKQSRTWKDSNSVKKNWWI